MLNLVVITAKIMLTIASGFVFCCTYLESENNDHPDISTGKMNSIACAPTPQSYLSRLLFFEN
jgi:hypothetical protein